MQIKSILQREGGTHIDMGGTVYHFAPNDAGDHVAEVSDDDHIERFLSITEGFEEYGDPVPDPGATGIEIMLKKELLALAGQNGIELNPSAPVVVLRKQLAIALPDYGKAPAAPAAPADPSV